MPTLRLAIPDPDAFVFQRHVMDGLPTMVVWVERQFDYHV
jgi:hypothetical protein